MTSRVSFRDLGEYSDWVEFAQRRSAGGETDRPVITPTEARAILGFAGDATPIAPRIERTWEHGGIAGEAISWSVGYGPRTQAWLLRPTSEPRALPGVVALHDHSAFKLLGKEKIADGPDGPDPRVGELRRLRYEGLAFANRLALRGFAVLVPDVFMWGSRKFAADLIAGTQTAASTPGRPAPEATIENGVAAYNRAAISHEHVLEKYCSLLGTTLAGVVAHEDRVAVNYLTSRPDVRGGGVGCIGLSGGGCRAALLQATSDDIAIAVIVAMMSTYRHLLDQHVAPHTWMFFPRNLAERADWPDLVACRAPAPLMVQYTLGDELFPTSGMKAAHERIQALYLAADAPNGYTGEFYDGPHWFSREMQDAAFARLETWAGD